MNIFHFDRFFSYCSHLGGTERNVNAMIFTEYLSSAICKKFKCFQLDRTNGTFFMDVEISWCWSFVSVWPLSGAL